MYNSCLISPAAPDPPLLVLFCCSHSAFYSICVCVCACVCVCIAKTIHTGFSPCIFFSFFHTRGEKSSQILTDAHRFHLIFFFFFTYSGRIAFPIGSPPKPLRSSDHLSLSVFSEATPARSCSAVRVNEAMCRPSSSHFLLYLLCSTVPLSLSHSHHPHLSLLRQ
jgi:hypothetical protein